jgi:hypothetical protein
MIHQHIWASPRPGMSEAEFQRYWLEEHAIRYASKIKQIKRYKISTRIDWSGERPQPIWSGVAEIWLRNEEDQLASLQSPEFLEGARLDEPKWAAFWNSQVLDTDNTPVVDRTGGTEAAGLKMMVLYKRRQGLSVADYRARHRDAAGALADISGLVRAELCFARDAWYGLGETRHDAVGHYWFPDLNALENAVARHRQTLLPGEGQDLVEARYVIPMVVKEHWIIGPAARD